MADIVPAPEERWSALDSGLSAPTLAWVTELRTLFAATGLSISRFARLHPMIDKGTVSRYLNGRRVPREGWFLDKVLAYLAMVDKPVTREVREHLVRLQLDALEAAHPQEYRLRVVNDELALTEARLREATRYANDLEQQVVKRTRQVEQLESERERLRAAWDEDRTRMQREYLWLGDETAYLREEIADFRDQLDLAREREAHAVVRCQELEEQLDDLEAGDLDGTNVPAGTEEMDILPRLNSNGDIAARGGASAASGGDARTSALEIMHLLAGRYAFGDLEALVGPGGLLSWRASQALAALCAFGQRVLDMDAEDFGMPEAVGELPKELLDRARASKMPQAPEEQPRGALTSLRPAYALMLEVIEVSWKRRDMNALVAAVHIASEYLPMLAWESVLGHAGDPALIGASVSGEGSRFGVPVEPGAVRECDHTRPERSACERTLRVSTEPEQGWRAYLDRQHSQVAQALGDCAARCRTPCSVMTRIDELVRDDLTQRCKLAAEFTDSALVRLRHAAPVGHGFGVPSPEEVKTAWVRSRTSLLRHPLGKLAMDGGEGDSYPLHGLPALFSAIAAAPIAPETLLHDVSTRITDLIGHDDGGKDTPLLASSESRSDTRRLRAETRRV
ncbi:hypothetical protein [Spirillospora sp. NPDC047279]|uniref:hypothetical protein n=1 Tax=Spirillospora sp. NPDC047279 TaxID=3155478 RepID=UPI0033D97C90